jgi:hypothetical protein
MCQKLDNQIHARKAEKQGVANQISPATTATSNSPSANTYPTRSCNSYYGPAPMELGATCYTKLTPELKNTCHFQNMK